MNFDILTEKFNIEIIQNDNCFVKIRIDKIKLPELLIFLKNNAEFDFNMLLSFIAVDLKDCFELIYSLYSTNSNKELQISVILDREVPKMPSVVKIFKSAHFDECEIYDLFGVEFENNPDLKRLFMPKGWIGHPLKKDYVANDARLSWNEVKNA